MNTTVKAITLAVITVSAMSIAHAEPLQAQAFRDAAAAKALAAIAAQQMDAAVKSGNAQSIRAAQYGLDNALAQVRSTARRQQIAQQMDAKNQAATAAANNLAAQQAAITAAMNLKTLQMNQTPAAYSQANVQGSINVAAASIQANTPVTATINGVTVQTTAGEIAKINPQIQIAVPHVPAIMASIQRKADDHSHDGAHSDHGTGNGSNNAANSASAHGLGGGSHIGGGSQQNGGFHGNW